MVAMKLCHLIYLYCLPDQVEYLHKTVLALITTVDEVVSTVNPMTDNNKTGKSLTPKYFPERGSATLVEENRARSTTTREYLLG